MYSVWSQEFLEERQRDEHVCLVGQDQWQRIHEEQEDVRRVFLRLRPQAEETGDLVAALGHPVLTTDLDVGARPIFLPGWMLQMLRLEGMGEAVRVEVLNDEALPAATRIVLRPHDSAFYGVDSNEELEPVLTRFGVLTAGTTIPVRVDALGGFLVAFDVIATEPANVVLMEGDEVALEFERALDDAGFRSAEPSGSAPAPASPEPFEDGPMIPVVAASTEPKGNVLGGAVKRTADGRPWNPWRGPMAT